MTYEIVEQINSRRAVVDFDTATGGTHRVEVISEDSEGFQELLATTASEVLSNTSPQE